ncbi:MAG: nuclear transport factor 2 family protein [Actinomycetota bacterium]|nr:nuclear transport factor 2 family protein [Actinomycetota bacterium]
MTEDEIATLEDRRFAAQISGDGAELDELLADNLRYTHSNAVVDTKASYIESITSGRVTYRDVRRSETDIQMADATAIVTGRAELDVSTPVGDRTIVLRYIAVWGAVGGDWKFLAWESTPFPA